MPDCCKLGYIPCEHVRYYESSQCYVVSFHDVEILDGRTIERGIIYFHESLVHRVNNDYYDKHYDEHYYEVDLCKNIYDIRVSNETIEVSREVLVNSYWRYFQKRYYIHAVSNRVVKESNLPGTKKVLFDLPIKFWDVAESKNCSVDVNVEKFIIQNHWNCTTMILGQKENNEKIKFSYQRKDGSWKDETVSAGRFWYLVKESKEKKKELGLF